MDAKTKRVLDGILAKATTEELREINSRVIENMKAIRTGKDAEAIREYRPGQKVSFTGRRGIKLTGTVTKINRTSVSVLVKPLFGNTPERWTVHASALTAVV